jgi:hypothetical protein
LAGEKRFVMRDVVEFEEPKGNLIADLRLAALVGFLLVVPLAILEFLNQTITTQNAPGLFVLFCMMWLLPMVFIMILLPLVRTVQVGKSVIEKPIGLLLRVAFLAAIAIMWAGILVDQMPCFLGVPNCD